MTILLRSANAVGNRMTIGTFRRRVAPRDPRVALGKRDRALDRAEVEVDPGAVARGAPEGGQLGGQSGEEAVEDRAVLGEVARQVAEPLDRAPQRVAPLPQQGRDAGGQLAHAGDGVADGGAVLGESAHQALQCHQGGVELPRALPHHREDLVEAGDHLADHLVAVGERRGQPCGARQQAVDGAALTLEDRDDLAAQRIDVVRVEELEQRLEAVEQQGQVERRGGVVEVEGVPDRQRPPRALRRLQRDVALADDIAEAQQRRRPVGQRGAVADAEPDLGEPVVGHVDPLDGADLDPGHPDVVARVEAGRVGEQRRIAVCVARRAVADRGGQRERGQHGDQAEAERLEQGEPQAPVACEPHRRVTSAPRRVAPSSRLDQDG
jgi:hypothetical protein